MGKPQVESYTIEWQVEPSLLHRKEKIRKENITFTLSSESIKAELKNPCISKEEFCQKAEKIVTKLGEVYTLLRGKYLEIMGLSSRYEIVRSNHPSLKVIKKGTIQVFGSDSGKSVWTGTITGPNERENEFKRCKEILEYSCETLWGAMSYYRLALSGIDQLAIAGNLYMAMEELLAKFNAGKKRGYWDWKEITKALEPINPNLTDNYLFDLKQVHRGRHAVDDNGQPNILLTSQELNEFKGAVREYILAYVEWLKANEK